MIKYEYNAINNPQFLGDRLLNKLGEDGWELVSHAYNSNTCDHFYTFKREKIKVEEPEWVDPMIEHLRKEEEIYENYKKSLQELSKKAEDRKEKQLIKEILSDPRNADGFSDDAHRLPKYQYQGYTYILNDRLTEIVGVEVPTTIVDRWHLEQSLKER